MVDAIDAKKITFNVEKIADKTWRGTCDACGWSESAGSEGALTRKRNRHAEEHRKATHGSPEVPTIMDAIDGVDNVPPVENPPEPVVDLEYFRQQKKAELDAEAAAFNAKHATDPMECGKDCLIQHEHSPLMGIIDEIQDIPDEVLDAAADSIGKMFRGVALNDAAAGDVVAVALQPGDRGYDLPRTRVGLTEARLALQKGASDRDRETWLAQRAESVSATAVAKLAMGGDLEFNIQELIKEKVHGSSFQGNKYTDWGKLREPALEAVGERLYGLRAESCLFFARANRRHSASPDGVAIHPETGHVALGEYKTCGKELTLAEAAAKGYLDQIQWQMYVMEATHCWLIWEWRRDDGMGGFEPEPGGRHLIMRDDDRIEYLKGLADKYLDALDAYRTNLASGDHPELDKSLNEALEDLMYYRDQVKECEEAVRGNLDRLGVKSVDFPHYRVSYTFGSARASLDRDLLEKDHPGLLAQYTKEGKAPEKPTLRITKRGEE